MIEMPHALKPPNPAVKFRPVRRTDIPDLHEACWPDRPVTYVDQLVKRARQITLQGRGFAVVIVGETPETLLGFGQLTMWPRGGEISDLIVDPSYRGRGLGTTMIQYLVKAAREMHADNVEIGVAYANTRALALYRRLGFRDSYSVTLTLNNGPEPVLYLQLDL